MKVDEFRLGRDYNYFEDKERGKNEKMQTSYKKRINLINNNLLNIYIGILDFIL